MNHPKPHYKYQNIHAAITTRVKIFKKTGWHHFSDIIKIAE